MRDLIVYGIPHCGTCKKALQWLEQSGIAYQFIDTKLQPPQAEEIRRWVEQLGTRPLRNTSGLSYRVLGPERDTWTDAQWIAALAADAMLLKRPLFVRDGVALLAGFRGSEATIRSKLGL